MKNTLRIGCISIIVALLASTPAIAQTHGGNANGGTGASMNGGSGSNDRNEGPSFGSGTPANSSSRASNSTSSNTNGDGNNTDDNGTAHNTHAYQSHRSTNTNNSSDDRNEQ